MWSRSAAARRDGGVLISSIVIGRQAWQRQTGYRQQARVEGTFLRYKRILGGSLRAKGFEAQMREARVGCTVLNKMFALGKVQSSAVTA